MKPLSIYVHIPFCKQKCAYCDFLSYKGCENDWKHYFSALEKEAEKAAENIIKKDNFDFEIKTIFFGGGTPTIVPAEYLIRVLRILEYNFDVCMAEAEITTEANPETVDLEILCALRQAGFNRISFGVQSFDDTMLRRISRIHSTKTAINAYLWAKQAGFENINIDIMFALPEQTKANWLETLNIAVKLNPSHISCYGLILEEGSALYNDPSFITIDDEIDREMYETAKKTLVSNGYKHYEISNFAKPGMECKHNTVYWVGQDYIGLGLGAHSFLNGVRFHNTYSMNDYINGDFSRKEEETLTIRDKYAEFFLLGLRLLDGVKESHFESRFGKTVDDIYNEVITPFVSNGLLIRNNGIIRLSDKGIDISNIIFQNFL